MANTNTNAQPASAQDDATPDKKAETPNAKVIDDVCIVDGDAVGGLAGVVVVEKPDAGQSSEIAMVPGQKYFFDFKESEVKSFEQDGSTLKLSFADGSTIILKGYAEATGGALPSTLAFRDEFSIDNIKVVETVKEEEQVAETEVRETKELLGPEQEPKTEGEKVAKVEPAAGEEQSAQDVADIEPAAGEEGAAGGDGNTGYGIGSSFDPQGVIPLDDVGPINPTALQYGVEFPQDEVRLIEEEGPNVPGDVKPEIESITKEIDETNVGPLSVSDVVQVEFGSDGPGTLLPNGSFSNSGSLLGGQLTSGGDLITVTQTVNGYIGTINGGATTVFDLVLNPNTGEFTFTQYGAIDHNDPNNPNDVISLVFGVNGVDADGDIASTTITINILDDAPAVAAPMIENIHEQDLAGGPIVVNDTLSIDFGNDTPGEVLPSGSSSFGGVAALTSAGQAVTITQTANGYVGTINGGATTVFDITVNPANGAYTYTQYKALDHDIANNTINLVFGVNVVDYDGDKTQTTITINIADSTPDIPQEGLPDIGKGYDIVDETALGPNVVSGNVPFDFGTDLPGTFTTDGAFSSSTALTSHGQAITVTSTPTGYVGATVSGTVFTLSVDAAGNYTFTQLAPVDHPDGTNPDDAIRLVFGVQVADADGDTDSGAITIDIKDDGPSIVSPAAQGLDEDALNPGPAQVNGVMTHDFGNDGAGDISPNGTTSFTGAPALTSGGHAVTISATATGYVGSSAIGDVFTITVNPATGAYQFTLLKPLDHVAGQDTITLNFGVVITDFDADSAAANIAIRITDDGPDIPGGDDPALGKGYEIVDETNLGPVTVGGNVPFDFGQDGPGALVFTGANSSSVPLTSHGQPVTIVATAGGYAGMVGGATVFEITLNQTTGAYSFTQYGVIDHPNAANPDDVIRLRFGIQVTDYDGDVATGSIVVDVKDDGPSITAPALGTVDEDALTPGPAQVAGVVTHDFGNDGEGSLDPNGSTSFTGVPSLTSNGAAVTITASAGGYVGTSAHGDVFTISINPATGAYTFTLLQPLDHAPGDAPILLNFGVKITDYDGDSAATNIAIRVLDDTPDIPGGDQPEPGKGYEIVDDTALGPNVASGTVPFDSGEDAPATLSFNGAPTFSGVPALTSHGEAISFVATANGYQGQTAGGTVIFELTLNGTTGAYTFTQFGPLDHDDITNPDDVLRLTFGIKVTDFDGDTANGSIIIDVKDDGPVAHDDHNKFCSTTGTKDYNVALILDVSGSMSGDKLALLKSSVANMIGDFGAYTGGEVKIHIVPFATSAQGAGTFTVTDPAQLTAALAFLNGLNADGFTNYESPMQTAINWLNGNTANDPIAGADTYTYFVSDGEPNRYVNGGGGTSSGSADVVMGEITGTDGTNEVTILQGLSTEVIAVGIGVGATTLARLDIIDSNGNALNVQDPNDLDSILQGTNPITGSATGNVITGENGGPGAADQLSMDPNTTVTKIAFGATVLNVGPAGVDIAGANGTLHINQDGSYTYTLNPNPTIVNFTITDQFVYTITDFDGDASQATLTLEACVPDDNPVLVQPEIVTVDETNLAPTTQVSDSVQADFGNDGPGTITGNGGFFSGVVLTSGTQPVNVTFNPATNTYTGATATSTVFTLVVQANGAYTFTLLDNLDHPNPADPNDPIQLQFGVTATDASNDTATGVITVNVLDDGPNAVNDGSTVLEGTLVTIGNVMGNDSVGQDVAGQITKVTFNGADHAIVQGVPTIVNGQYGTLTINTDGSYSYTSFGTNTSQVVDHFTYTLRDFDGDTDVANLDITVQDRDYNPIIADPRPLVTDETDLNPTDSDSSTITANFGNDGPGTFSVTGAGTFAYNGHDGAQLTSDGVPVVVSVQGNDYVGTAGGAEIFRLSLNSTTGQYQFTLKGVLDHGDPNNPDDAITLNFGVTATDVDGDTDTGTIQVLVKDDAPNANDDVNEFCATEGTKDYNVALILDVSGSMSGDKLALLKSSVSNLLTNFNNYNGGTVKIHIVPFATSAQAAATFTVTNDADFALALAFLNGLNADGFTNYESPMQSAISWLNGATANDPIAGADTYTYFVSDGEPNRYVNNNGGTATGDANASMGQITGSDGTNEVATLQSLSTQVIAVGIDVSATAMARLDIIDSNGNALDVQNPNDLNAVLQGTNPITGSADGNVITGVNGGPGAADVVSKDVDSLVTKIAFGATEVNVGAGGADINGAYGKLHINPDGSYTYTLFPNVSGQNLTDQFTYTLTDNDGDPSIATLTLKAEECCDPTTVDITVNNGVDDVIVKEDGQISVPYTASYAGGNGNEIMTLTLTTGLTTGWVITTPGWTNAGGGVYTLTLAAGQTNHSGSITFKPPANSDVDLSGLSMKASVFDPDTASSVQDTDTFRVVVDAVIDTPTLTVPGNQTYYWYMFEPQTANLPISSKVTDTDGSEQIVKITLDLNNPFTNPNGGFTSLESMGVSLNKGTEVSPGVWEIAVNNGDAAAALSGLKIQIPAGANSWWPIHQSVTGGHTATITVKSYAKEVNLGGVEVDLTDNSTVVVKNFCLDFYLTPLALDLDGNGISIVSQEAGVMFDMNNNGTLDKTSWVGSGEGLLALDLDQDGAITSQSELFGNDVGIADGFTKLAQHDLNKDGVINKDDAVFSDLKVWVDANQDGISQTGELHTLADLKIASIGLEVQTGDVAEGGQLAYVGAFTYEDGQKGEVADVLFNVVEGNAINDVLVLNGTDGRDTLLGSDARDQLMGGFGEDTLYGGAGDDIFLFQKADGSVDTIKDFELGHDVLDVSALLQGYDALQDSINDFVFATQNGDNTTISVDVDGKAGAAAAMDIAVLQAVTGLDLADIMDLTQNGEKTAV